MEPNSWKIELKAPFGGFAPGYWKNSYPSFGNKNMAGAMVNVDMLDPAKITQGPGLATLTAGDQTGAVTTLIKHILDIPTSSDVSFAIGGNKLYQISSAAVANAGIWPHTIDKATVTGEDGESVAYYGGALYYLYNHSGNAGDIGKYDLATTFDDDWGSTVPTAAAALQNAPHASVVGNDDVLYFTNGPYVGWYDHISNTISVDDLDFLTGSQAVDVRYDNNMVVVAVNYPNLTGNNNNWGMICYWDGLAASWNDQMPNPRVKGRIGAIYVKQGTVYVWYQNAGDSGYNFGYVSGNSVKKIRSYSGSLPNFAQVGELNETIVWISGGLLYSYGATDELMTPVLSQLGPGGYTTVGGMASPFGTVLVASNQTTSYKLAKFSGYSLGSFTSLLFDCDTSVIDEVVVYYEPTATGSRCDIKIESNKGAATLTLQSPGETGTITHGNDSGQSKKTFQPQIECNNFRVILDWANGSAVNPQGIRSVIIRGHAAERVS